MIFCFCEVGRASIAAWPAAGVTSAAESDEEDSWASTKISGGRREQRLSICSDVAFETYSVVMDDGRRSGSVVYGLSAFCCCWLEDEAELPLRELRKFWTMAFVSLPPCPDEALSG